VSWDDWLGYADVAAPLLRVGQDDIAVQIYTSGTTGRPKG
jgi:long-subunit acyl-CoA synthetase (AMP-forming)